jgi:hypothetical protein
MKRIRVAQGVAAWLAAVGMCFPGTVLAAAPAAGAVQDVALEKGAILLGRVVDVQGAGVAGVLVSLQYQEREVAAVTTDRDGQFAVRGVRGGVYVAATRQATGAYRLWTSDAAPPTAETRLVLVQGQVVRGQSPEEAPQGLFGHPLLLAAIVTTAVAVPVALCSSHHDPASP